MKNEQHQSTSPTDSRALLSVRQQGQRMTLEQRRAAQDVFLEAFALNCNVTASCVKAGVDHSMISYWEKHDPKFAAHYATAKAKADDMIRAAWWTRAIQGVKKPLTCAKGLIYEEVVGKDGKTKQQPVMVTEYSDSLLALMIKSRLPEAAGQGSTFMQQATVATNADGQAVVQIKTQWGSAPALERSSGGGSGEE